MSFIDPDHEVSTPPSHTPLLVVVIFTAIIGTNLLAFGGNWVAQAVGAALAVTAVVGGRVVYVGLRQH